jgi:hypothetical protein
MNDSLEDRKVRTQHWIWNNVLLEQVKLGVDDWHLVYLKVFEKVWGNLENGLTLGELHAICYFR